MIENEVAQGLIDAAEENDRKMTAARIEQLVVSYRFFKKAGMSDEDVKKAMGLTAFEMKKIQHETAKPKYR